MFRGNADVHSSGEIDYMELQTGQEFFTLLNGSDKII